MKPRNRIGFTLIELLVVIAIIAILAAILFPVFAAARDKARTIACLSNQKQIGTALMMYTQDFDENLPGWPDPRGNPMFIAGYSWQMIVPVMDPYIKNRQVWIDPNANDAVSPLNGPAKDRFVCNYGYSEYMYNTNHGSAQFGSQPPFFPVWNPLSSLSSTKAGVAQIAVVADSAFPGIFNDWSNLDGYRIQGEPNKAAFGLGRIKYANGGSGSIGNWKPDEPRHSGYGANVIFADGHAKFINGGSIRGAYNPNPSSTDATTGGFVEWPVVNPANVPQ